MFYVVVVVFFGHLLWSPQREAPDAKILSRIKIARPETARAITIDLNSRNDSYSQSGRRDIVNWSENPSYLHSFEEWDENENRRM